MDGPFEMGKFEMSNRQFEMSGSSVMQLPRVVFQTGRISEAGTRLAVLLFPRPFPTAVIQESSYFVNTSRFECIYSGEGVGFSTCSRGRLLFDLNQYFSFVKPVFFEFFNLIFPFLRPITGFF